MATAKHIRQTLKSKQGPVKPRAPADVPADDPLAPLAELAKSAAEGKFPAAKAVLMGAGWTLTAERFLVPTTDSAAQFFGLDRNTMVGWKKAGMPVAGVIAAGKPVPVDLGDVARWFLARWRQRQSMTGEGGMSASMEAVRRNNAALTGLELEEKRGRLVKRVDADAAVDAGVDAFINGLANMRERLCRVHPAAADDIDRETAATAERVRDALRLEGERQSPPPAAGSDRGGAVVDSMDPGTP